MLARWIATVAALLLACAQASAHVRSERAADLGTFAAGTEHALEIQRSAANASPGELPTNPKTALPARASLENSASGKNAPVSDCHAWENWSPLRKCASGVDKYLYGNGNPGSYIDPDGRAGYATDVRDHFDANDEWYANQIAAEGTGWFEALGLGAMRTLNQIGSTPARAFNAVTDIAASVAPGEFFEGVREEGQRETAGNAQMAWDAAGSVVNAGVHPVDTVVAAHGAAVGFTVDLAMGEKSAAAGLGGGIAGLIAAPLGGRIVTPGWNTAREQFAKLREKVNMPARVTETGDGSPGLDLECCARCFGAGTLVMTAEGLQPIESVTVGQGVMARDEETGETALRTVQHVIVREDREVFDLTFADGEKREVISVTADHRFHTVERGWVVSGELQVGEAIESLDGRRLVFESRSAQSRKAPTFNLSVTEDHNYFVGESGLWVHNCAPCNGVDGSADPGLVLRVEMEPGFDARAFDRKVAQLRSDISRGDVYSNIPHGVSRNDRSKLTRDYRRRLEDRVVRFYRENKAAMEAALEKLRLSDIDHRRDLQLDGTNSSNNLQSLHSATNQGLGRQISRQLPYGVRKRVSSIEVVNEGDQ